MTPREPERTTAVDSQAWTCAGPCHGQFIGRRPADGTCAQCTVLAVTTEPAAAERAKLERAAAAVQVAARLDRIRALTPGQCRRALMFLDGYAPQGVDSALAAVTPLTCPEGCGDADADDEAAAVPAYTAELDGTENFGRANPAGAS